MTISDLVRLAEAKMANLQSLITVATRLGDDVRIASLELEFSDTTKTLSDLKSLLE